MIIVALPMALSAQIGYRWLDAKYNIPILNDYYHHDFTLLRQAGFWQIGKMDDLSVYVLYDSLPMITPLVSPQEFTNPYQKEYIGYKNRSDPQLSILVSDTMYIKHKVFIGTKQEATAFLLQTNPVDSSKFTEAYVAVRKVRILPMNCDSTYVWSQDRSIRGAIEANLNGKWLPITFDHYNRCGMGYYDYLITNKNLIDLQLIINYGEIPVKMRLKIFHNLKEYSTSNEFDGHIFLSQATAFGKYSSSRYRTLPGYLPAEGELK